MIPHKVLNIRGYICTYLALFFIFVFIRLLEYQILQFHAFCFDNPDHVGHGDGHDTPAYYAKLRELDGYVGRIVDAIKEAGIYENSIIIVTADHGGINKGHGGKTMEEMETPFIIAGKNIKKGGAFEESMMQFDCASTIASVFNLEQPQVWIGRPMTQVFE